jgi:hypothetical protein
VTWALYVALLLVYGYILDSVDHRRGRPLMSLDMFLACCFGGLAFAWAGIGLLLDSITS